MKIIMMEGFTLEQAISTLRAIDEPLKAACSREALVSFVWLDTLGHHWPSKMTPELRELSQSSRFLSRRKRVAI